jgi:5'-AMP-activated protein kinase catalytic alpha subunit
VEVVGGYRLGRSIGKGSSGEVKEATKVTTGEKFAIKIVSPRTISERIALRREIRNHERLRHEHVVKILEVLRNGNTTYIVMELLSGKDLFDVIEQSRLGRLDEVDARRHFQQIIAGVEYCHMNKVTHRDLKPENIFLTDADIVKIIDFGFSTTIRNGRFLTQKCGTRGYAAPEIHRGQYEGPAADIFSCGVILFVLLCGHMPFHFDKVDSFLPSTQVRPLDMPSSVSEPAKNLIERILKADPKERISLSSIKKHPWLTSSQD